MKNLEKGLAPGTVLSSKILAKNMGEVWWGRLAGAWRSESIFCLIVSVQLKQTFVYQIFVFVHLHANCLFPV